MDATTTAPEGEDHLQSFLTRLSSLVDSVERDHPEPESSSLLSTNIELHHGLPRLIWICLTCENGADVACPDRGNVSLQEWIVEWKRIGLLLAQDDVISAFQIHAIASQAIHFDKANTIDSCLSPASFQRGVLFRMTCLLLCCYSLRQCKENPGKYLKRWKSLLFETMQLFQRRFVPPDYNVQLVDDGFLSSSINLVASYMIPSIWCVRRVLLSHEPLQRNPKLAAAIVASAINIVVQLIVLYHGYHQIDSESGDKRCHVTKIAGPGDSMVLTLLECINVILEGRFDLVWCHVSRSIHRRDHHENIKWDGDSQTMSSALSYWCSWRQDDDEDAYEESTEYVCHVDTVWDNKGIALLAAHGFHTDYRPLVWHPIYSWNLFFPYVPILLEEEENLSSQILAFKLLRSLLEVTPRATLVLRTTPKNQDGRPNHAAVQTFQLLSNHILRMTSVSVVSPSQPAEAQHHLPDGTQCFSFFMKPLLSKYVPINQVSLVKHLVDTCPQPGFKPKLLDLLRPFVFWNKHNDKENESDQVSGGQIAAWQYLDDLWGEIMEKCFPDATSSQSPSPMTGWDRMIDQTELCVSILSVVRLWSLVHSPSNLWPPSLSHLHKEPLKRLYVSIQANLDQWTSSDTTTSRPDEHHRLNLLESALETTIPLVPS